MIIGWSSDKKIFKISANENTLWTLAAMLNLKSAPKNRVRVRVRVRVRTIQ
jgi:hypothetical protein